MDGLNWDLLNDGIGNAKNARSLVWSARTPPVMSLGVRASHEVATRAGFRYIQFHEPTEEEIAAVMGYIASLEPEPSPYLAVRDDGSRRMTASAQRGRTIYESGEAGCSHCHPGPLFTDLQSYDVGTRNPRDTTGEYDTPTLVELWRTAPYLHDGRAATLESVFREHNREDRHGRTSHLSEEQLHDLVQYLLSL
jgi:cytochrome c peroxidase